MIGIHVLPDQRHLAHAGIGQPLDLSDDLFNWPRNFSAARVRHHAKGAELVAAFLHCDEGGNAALGNRVPFGRSQSFKLVLDWKFGVDDFLAGLSARDHLRQAVIILRADHQIDRAGAADDFLPSACATQPATAISMWRPSRAAASFNSRMRPISE